MIFWDKSTVMNAMGRVEVKTRTRRHFRVIVADRSGHFRETVRRVLDEEQLPTVVEEAATLADTVRLCRRLRPELVLLDVDLVLGESPVRLRRLAQAFPRIRVVVMLNETSEEYRRAVAERWGYACIAKDQVEGALELIAGRPQSLAVRRARG